MQSCPALALRGKSPSLAVISPFRGTYAAYMPHFQAGRYDAWLRQRLAAFCADGVDLHHARHLLGLASGHLARFSCQNHLRLLFRNACIYMPDITASGKRGKEEKDGQTTFSLSLTMILSKILMNVKQISRFCKIIWNDACFFLLLSNIFSSFVFYRP